MFTLTKQERTVLCVLGLVVFIGSILNYSFKKFPEIKDLINLIDNDAIYFKVNLNTATQKELEALPYIGEYTAKNIIYYRNKFGPFTSIEQLKSVKGIRLKNYEIFSKYLFLK